MDNNSILGNEECEPTDAGLTLQEVRDDSSRADIGQFVDTEEREPSRRELLVVEEEVKSISTQDIADLGPVSWLLRASRNAARYSKEKSELDVVNNIRLVIFFAKKYRNLGLDFEDLIQEGVIGLMKAVERHDPAKGKLSTYASWWILQACRRALSNQSKTIRLPVSAFEKRRAIKNAAVNLEQKLGRRPTLPEICDATGFRIESIVDTFSQTGTVSVSLDAPLLHGEPNGSRVGDTIACGSTLAPDEVLMEKERAAGFDDVMKKVEDSSLISERDKEIFRHHFSVGSKVRIFRSLEATGEKFLVTRERIRQVLSKVSRRVKISGDQLSLNKPYAYKKRKKGKRSFHMRASPAYVQWAPTSTQADIPHRLVEFLAFAYEQEVSCVFSEKIHTEVVWVRRLAAYLLVEIGGMRRNTLSIVCDGHLALAAGSVSEMAREIANDPFIRRDVEGLSAHFKSVMKL